MMVFHLTRRTRLFFGALGILLLLLVVIDITGFGKDALSVSVDLSGSDDAARAAFLTEYGWQVSAHPMETAEFTLPKTMTPTLRVYNDLQKSQKMDLTPYFGKTVTRYTYEIRNYPDGITGVRANLLVYDGKIIAGDVCTVASDGFMHGLAPSSAGISPKSVALIYE